MITTSSAVPVSIPTSTWADRYERLRELGVDFGARLLDDAQGLVLFLREGMASWMTEIAATAPVGPVRLTTLDADDRRPTRRRRCEITLMLTSMVGAALEEVLV